MSVRKRLVEFAYGGPAPKVSELRADLKDMFKKFDDMTDTADQACKLAEERGEQILELEAQVKMFENLATGREREMKHATAERKRAERIEQDKLSENRRLEAKVARLEAAPPGDPELEELARQMLASMTGPRKRMTRLLKQRARERGGRDDCGG